MVASSAVFPVQVSLARWFGAEDARARLVLGACRGRSARWLARRVRRTLRLPRLLLRLRGHLLPPAEPLALLRPGDTLEAIPAMDSVVDLSREDRSLAARRARKRRRSASPPPAPCPCPSPSPGPLPAPWSERASPAPSPAPPAAWPPPRSPPAAPPSGSEAELDSLQEMKQRALQLLERHVAERAPRARRRRVRRRRAPAPLAPEPAVGPEPEPAVERQLAPEPARGASVVRCAAGAAAAGRRVRALPAAAAAGAEPPPERATGLVDD